MADLIVHFSQSCLNFTVQNNFNHVGSRLRRCRTERTAFDKCFFSTLRASNAIPTASIDESLRPFSDVFVHFRSSLDSCFLRSPFASERSFFAPLLVDDDALYLRTIYSSELSSRLWSLPELNSPRPSLDALAICHVDNFKSHLFGSGNIHTQIPISNSSSCLLQESELLCYRDTLDRNPDYLQLIYSRDFSLRTCLRNLRSTSVCKNRDHSRLRSCICQAKAELEEAVQMAMISCVQKEKRTNDAIGLQRDQPQPQSQPVTHIHVLPTQQSLPASNNTSTGSK
ncbi:hypothetical protein WR25_18478 [Diploscapter pachys]|uniref:Uncharacterized protein n=1 Tax=Diploscapter pachys TaxID=2018661 RepID=A0A2A2KMT1_9BILA|nr:hypothetical protein WR25_18478 [Diploscapter pachys]